MSHNTHVFLIDNCNDLGDAMFTMDNNLINNPPDTCEYFRILGAINLHTGEYAEWTQLIGNNPNKIKSKSDLADGRGHFISQYDGRENEEEVNGVTYYIYRIN